MCLQALWSCFRSWVCRVVVVCRALVVVVVEER